MAMKTTEIPRYDERSGRVFNSILQMLLVSLNILESHKRDGKWYTVLRSSAIIISLSQAQRDQLLCLVTAAIVPPPFCCKSKIINGIVSK